MDVEKCRTPKWKKVISILGSITLLHETLEIRFPTQCIHHILSSRLNPEFVFSQHIVTLQGWEVISDKTLKMDEDRMIRMKTENYSLLRARKQSESYSIRHKNPFEKEVTFRLMVRVHYDQR
jgi:hypothetical protein